MEPGKQPRLRLRTDRVLHLCQERGVGTEQKDIARYTGLNRATINRVFRGAQAPGEFIIARFLKAFDGVRFEELFELVDDEDKVKVAAA